MDDRKAKNQMNKRIVWDYWQKLNHAEAKDIPRILQAAYRKDIDWNGPHPINRRVGIEGVAADFWLPLLRSFDGLRRETDILMGGVSDGEDWVSGIGYFVGTFVHDWLGIPATGQKTLIHFGQFYVMREGRIAEGYLILDLLSVMKQAGFQVLPPARGAEGGRLPGPRGGGGILLTEQDELESRKTCQLMEAMGHGLMRYVRPRDGADMRSMEQWHYWHPQMHWYGPTGIGASLNLEQFADFHQRPWLHGFGDRHLDEPGGGRIMAAMGEGQYSCAGIWDTKFSRHHGEYQGVAPTGRMMTIRDFDWYKREGDHLIQNWIPIDLIDLFRQIGVDLFERLRDQVELRQRGLHWYDPKQRQASAAGTSEPLAVVSLRQF